MKKKTILCLTSFALILIIIAGGVMLSMWKKDKTTPKEPQKESQSGTLIVNNGTAVIENVVIHFKENANYADLPLTEVMKSLGMTVAWIDNDTADIAYNEKKYVLKLSEVSLVEFEQSFNLLSPTPGGKRSYTVLNKELVLDSNTMKSALYQMGEDVSIGIDSSKLIVSITKKAN